MSNSYDLRKNREKVKEIKTNLETKKNKIDQLESNKKQLVEAVMELSNMKITDQSKQIITESINSAIEQNKEKGLEVSNEIGQDLKDIESIKQDTMESLKDANIEKSNIDKKKNMLNKFGMGGALDKASGEIQSNISELNELKDDSINVMRDLEKASQKAGNL